MNFHELHIEDKNKKKTVFMQSLIGIFVLQMQTPYALDMLAIFFIRANKTTF